MKDQSGKWNPNIHLEPSPLPEGISHFIMSGFYRALGTADELIEQLETEEARRLYAAQLAYYRGDFKETEGIAEELLKQELCFESKAECELLLGICAIPAGNVYKWNRAWQLLTELESERKDHPAAMICKVWLAIALVTEDVPDWLKKGKFSEYPRPVYASLSHLYLKWLMNQKDYEGICKAAEPIITAVGHEGVLLAEIYLHFITAVAYLNLGDRESAEEHMNTALEQALPDRLYGAIAEFRRNLGHLLGDALKQRDPQGYTRVCALYRQIGQGYVKLYSSITGNPITKDLTIREYEVADMAVQGIHNAEIGRRIGITEGSVKTYLSNIYQKLNISKREELKKYI